MPKSLFPEGFQKLSSAMQGIAPHPCPPHLTRRLLWQTKPEANLPEGNGPPGPGEAPPETTAKFISGHQTSGNWLPYGDRDIAMGDARRGLGPALGLINANWNLENRHHISTNLTAFGVASSQVTEPTTRYRPGGPWQPSKR